MHSLKKSPDFEDLDKDLLLNVLMEKCEKLEAQFESLREVGLSF